MQVKTFRAASIAEALTQVKNELGPDAIILGNRRLETSPDQTQVEVTAAIESQPLASAPGDHQLSKEVREIKGLLSLLISSKDLFAQLQTQEPLAELYHSLLVRGLDERFAFTLLKKALAQVGNVFTDRGRLIEAFKGQLLDIVKFSKPFQHLTAADQEPPAFTFVGPTGVGKTTTLAKLAAYLKIKRQLKVGIISLDTYRIGAVHQLQTYAKILDAPMSVAQTRAEFLGARKQLQDQDLVLIDTTGKNFLVREHIGRLQEIFSGCSNLHHLLVLSATAKDADLRQTVAHFKSCHIRSVIFTKVDETLNHGCMLNQLLRFSYPVSYLGTGQRVPEDLELATPRRLLTFLFPPVNGSTRED